MDIWPRQRYAANTSHVFFSAVVGLGDYSWDTHAVLNVRCLDTVVWSSRQKRRRRVGGNNGVVGIVVVVVVVVAVVVVFVFVGNDRGQDLAHLCVLTLESINLLFRGGDETLFALSCHFCMKTVALASISLSYSMYNSQERETCE